MPADELRPGDSTTWSGKKKYLSLFGTKLIFVYQPLKNDDHGGIWFGACHPYVGRDEMMIKYLMDINDT